jgi:hypothetical protein
MHRILVVPSSNLGPKAGYPKNLLCFHQLLQTDIRGVVVNIYASYSGCAGSNLGPETGYLNHFRGFPQFVQTDVQFCFVFERSSLQIQARRMAILTGV